MKMKPSPFSLCPVGTVQAVGSASVPVSASAFIWAAVKKSISNRDDEIVL
jgi:hypothetical protein